MGDSIFSTKLISAIDGSLRLHITMNLSARETETGL